MDTLRKLIDQYDVVSFDIFDTLIYRNVLQPSDIFKIVERKYNKQYGTNLNFYRKRIDAEKKARTIFPYREVNIDEIYEVLNTSLGKDVAQQLKKIEKETELIYCVRNLQIIPYYEYCKKMGKKIFIISDMYLPVDFIQIILSKNNIDGYVKIFDSCEYRLTKWEKGELFQKVCSEYHIEPEKILHIGNDQQADYKMATKVGYQAYLIETKQNTFNYDGSLYVSNSEVFEFNIIQKFLGNIVQQDTSRAYQIGVGVFGPLLYAYLQWMIQQAKKLHIERLFFLSRDGYVLKKGFELLNVDIDGNYLYASRRAFIVPCFQFCKNIDEILDCYKSWSIEFSLEVLFTRMGLQISKYKELLKKYHLKETDIITYQDVTLQGNIRELLEELKPDILKESQIQYQLTLEYLRAQNMQGKVGIIDVGARCSIELALRRLITRAQLPLQIYGLYLNIFCNETEKRYSYLKSQDDRDKLLMYRFCYMFIEVFLSAPHGTVLGYKQVNNEIVPELDSYEYQEFPADAKKIEELQRGALDFVKNFKMQLAGEIEITSSMALANFRQFGMYPNLYDAQYWGELNFWADCFLPMAKPKKIGFYLLHFSQLILDFRKSLWPSGFLMRLCHTTFANRIIICIYKLIKG